ncbi:hypothetical protein AB0P21_35815 [Kribbella sp. NPDC056861]|uniref:hypothetical protein n=1 Tax=Kribbella sp. NPDC056861 TaxID=3154857 RepID=UPI003444A6AC
MAMVDELDSVVSYVAEVLSGAVDGDWSVPAGDLEWSCAFTVEHVGQALLHWSTQLAVNAETGYVRWRSQVQNGAPPAGMIDFLEAAGRILGLVVQAAPAGTRAFHPWGIADPDGFAGMGCVELLLHGKDLADGLALRYEPSAEVCLRVLTRMFAHRSDELADLGADSWTALQWVTGRVDLPGRPSVQPWKWRATPLDEVWNPTPEPAPMRFMV